MRLVSLILISIITTANAEILVGGIVVNNETRLIYKDTETPVCIIAKPNDSFEWVTEKDILIPVKEFVVKYNVANKLTEKESIFCAKKLPIVMKNSGHPTRPMYHDNFTKNGSRIVTGAVCENGMIKPYSSIDSSRGYFYATNFVGDRGLVICQ